MSKKIRSLVVSLICCFALSGCFDKKDENALVVGLSSDYPPFEFQQGGEVVGFDVDIASEIAKRNDKKLIIKDMPLYSLIASLQNNSLDLIVSGISPTDERKNIVSFSHIYYKSKMAVLFESTKSSVKEAGDLKGKIIGVQTGSTMEAYLADHDKFPEVTVLSQDSNNQLIEHLKIGRVDAVLLDLDQAVEFSKMGENFAYLPIDVDDGYGFAVAIAKNNEILRNKVNECILKMQEDGTIEELKKKWLVNHEIVQNMKQENIKSENVEQDSNIDELKANPLSNDEHKVLDQDIKQEKIENSAEGVTIDSTDGIIDHNKDSNLENSVKN